MGKVIEKLKKAKMAVCATAASAAATVMTGFTALAAVEGPATAGDVSYDSFSAIVSGILGEINVTSILGIIAGVIAACIAFVFMWWGLRKVISMIMSAFRKGRVSA